MSIRTIALEEHFATPDFMEGPGAGLVAQARSVEAARMNRGDRLLGGLMDSTSRPRF